MKMKLWIGLIVMIILASSVLAVTSVSDLAITTPSINTTGNIRTGGNLSVYDLEVRSGQSITLAGATFENKGHYTSINTNWIVEEDDQPSAFLGVFANNGSTATNAHLALEALNSSFVFVKNSPLHPIAPSSAGIINEGGNFGTFVEHLQDIIWFHYDSLTKDAYGNIITLIGAERLMTLNDTGLILHNGSLSVDGDADITGILDVNITTAERVLGDDIRGDFMRAKDLEVTVSLEPSSGVDLGTSVKKFDEGFFATDVYIDGVSVCLESGVNCPINQTENFTFFGDLNVTGNLKVSNDFTIGDGVVFVDKSNGGINLGSLILGTDRLNVYSPTTGVQTGIASFYDSSNNIKFRIRDEWTASSIPPRLESHSALGFGLLTTENAPFIWYIDGTGNEKMRLTSTGLGIGTSSPIGKLDVNGTLNVETLNVKNGSINLGDSSDSSARFLKLLNSFGTGKIILGSGGSGGHIMIDSVDSKPIRFRPGGVEAMRVSGDGDVGIGTSNPVSTLHVNGSGVVIGGNFNSYESLKETSFVVDVNSSLGQVVLVSHNGTERQKMEFHAKEYEFETGESGNRNYFVMDTNGQIGIGTTIPDYLLHVAGDDVEPNVQLERIDNIIGIGYQLGTLIWKAGEVTPSEIAQMRVTATENWNATSSPTRFSFRTASSGSVTPVLRMSIDESGIDVQGNYIHQGNVGFTGTCINVTYSGGIAVSCND